MKFNLIIFASSIVLLTKISEYLNLMKKSADVMLKERKIVNKIERAEEKVIPYCDNVKIHFDEIRYHADKLELLVEDKLWSYSKFRDMLFTR